MSVSRRSSGVTSIVVAGLATVVLAVPVAGDGHSGVPDITADCVGDASALESARQLLEGQGLSPEMIDEAMAFACSINAFSSMDAGGGLTLEAILGGEEVPDGLGGIAYDSVPDIDEQAVYNGAEVTFIEDILKAQGVSPEQIEQLLAMYEQVAVLGGGGGAGKVSTASGDDAVRTEDITLNFIEDILKAQGMAPAEVEQLLAMYEQMGLVGEDGELMPEGLPLDFLEQMLGGEQSDTVGGLTLEAIPDTDDEVSVVVNHEEQYDPDVLRGLAVADPAGTVEAAVAAAAAQRGIDPAALQQMTLEDILGLLAED